jgi:hypothetical protein
MDKDKLILRLRTYRHMGLYRLWKLFNRRPTLERPIFAIGCPRSGTSIFARLLGEHPDIINYSEAGTIWDPDNYYNGEADHHWTVDEVREKDVQRIVSHFRFEQWMSKRKRLLNKHLRNSVRIAYIKKIFPDATFIHVIRDGRAVVNSILRKVEEQPYRKEIPFWNFCKPPNWRELQQKDAVAQTAWQWREIVQHILTFSAELKNRYIEVKYDQLCSEPREMLAHVLTKLEMEDRGGFLMRKIPDKLRDADYKWKQYLNEAEIKVINEIQEPLLRQLGYLP